MDFVYGKLLCCLENPNYTLRACKSSVVLHFTFKGKACLPTRPGSQVNVELLLEILEELQGLVQAAHGDTAEDLRVGLLGTANLRNPAVDWSAIQGRRRVCIILWYHFV